MEPYEFSYIMEDALESGMISAMFSGIPSSLLSIAAYVLSALALYTVAQRRGLNRPWLAWIPVVNCWILGSLSDQYRYVVKGEVKSKRKVLLVLNILSTVIGIAMVGICIAMVVGLTGDIIHGADEEAMLRSVLGPVVGILGLCLPLAGIAIAYAVIRYMALYDVYRSMDPVNCVLFTILSILVSITEPFFLFFSRNKDLGMPPRRQEPVYQAPAYMPQEPAQEQEPQMNFWDSEPENKDYL
jgi:hypothetical protein